MMNSLLNVNRLTVVIAVVALLGFPLVAVWVSSSASDAQGGVETVGVTYPRNYRQTFTLYATVQRPDGTIRDLYVNPVGLAAMQSNHVFPSGTVLVIEGYNAAKDSNGQSLTDADGRYVRGEAMPFVHVREKRVGWSSGDFTSTARNGAWNFGSFDMQTGAVYAESLNACFLCHNTAPQDFTYSVEAMAEFEQTGQAVYFFCRTTGRTACE